MYSSFGFLILTTVFVLGHCDGKYTEFSEINCTKQIRSVITAMKNEVSCKPHNTSVALNPKPGQTFLPSSVSVPRCSGLTSERFDCTPKANGTQIIQVHVISVNTFAGRGSKKQQCAVVNIEAHTSCEHTCKIKETDCNKLQRYVENGCKCVCKDEVKKHVRGTTDNKEWNEEDCKWKCNMKTECTTGLSWNDDFCKCL